MCKGGGSLSMTSSNDFRKMALRGRDDFTKKTVELLAKRAAGKCSMCGCATWGPNDNHYRATNIGQAAHIAAAAEGGPRYDKKMSSEDRSSISNGLWLCSNCHDQVDRNVDSYPTKLLRQIKNEAESRAKRELGVATSKQATNGTVSMQACCNKVVICFLSLQSGGMVESCVSAAAIVEIRKARSLLVAMHGQKVGWEEAKKVIQIVDFIRIPDDSYLPEVGTELLSLLERLLAYSQEAVLQLEVIRRVKEVMDGYHSMWTKKEVKTVSDMMEDLAKRQNKTNSKVFQSAIALVKDLSQLVGQRDTTLCDIPKATLRSVMASRRRGRQGGGREEVDYDGEQPPTKMSLQTSDDYMEEYLEKMAALAQLTEETDYAQRCLDIEEEIKLCGYEPNIL